MTKSQNTKSEQLTEQWKKGELPEGYYYIKTRNETNIDEYIQWYKDHGIPSEKSFAYFNVQQVLAPVPSYEEWKSSDKLILTLMDHIKEKSDLLQRAMVKNAQLKELLKEVLRHELSLKEISELTRKISQVLGEQK